MNFIDKTVTAQRFVFKNAELFNNRYDYCCSVDGVTVNDDIHFDKELVELFAKLINTNN